MKMKVKMDKRWKCNFDQIEIKYMKLNIELLDK